MVCSVYSQPVGDQAGAVLANDAGFSAVARPLSLAEHVTKVVRDDILAGRLRSGERLTEADVIARTGVSRTPVREGLKVLSAEGLVVSYRGRGTYVAFRLPPNEARIIYDIRLLIEPYLTGLAAVRATPSSLRVIETILDQFCEAVDGGPEEASRLDAEFHLSIYDLSESQFRSILQTYWSRIQLELSEHVYVAEEPRNFMQEHRDIFVALSAGDPGVAEERMRAHIEHGLKAHERYVASSTARDVDEGARMVSVSGS